MLVAVIGPSANLCMDILDALWHLIVWVVGTDSEGSLFKYIGGSVVERNVRNSLTPLGWGWSVGVQLQF